MIYCRQNTVVKHLVAEAKNEPIQIWCQELSKMGTRLKMFRLSNQIKNDQKDEVGENFIKC